MSTTLTAVVIVIVVVVVLGLAVRIVKQYERGVLFRFGRVVGAREPGLRLIIRIVDERLRRDRSDRPDHAAEGGGPAHARRDAVGDRPDQQGHP